MQTFSEYPGQQPPAPNKHLSHLEDLIFDGPQAVVFVLDILHEFKKTLHGGYVSDALNVSVKWDGSPAIVFGPDPITNAFFVATKSAFNKVPKLAHTHDEINQLYAEHPIVHILHQALDELVALKPEQILQGDILFAKSTPRDMKGAVRPMTVDGTQYLVFQPNTILYAVEASSDLAAQIEAAEIGLVIHTAYRGTGSLLNTYRSKPISPLSYAKLEKTSRVLTLDANYDDVSGTASFTAEEYEDFALALAAIYNTQHNVFVSTYDRLLHTPELRTFIQLFINSQVRANVTTILSVADFLSFLVDRMHVEEATRKTPGGQESVRMRYVGYTVEVESIGDQIAALFALHAAVQRAKNIVIKKLGQLSRIRTFLPQESGYRVTGPEGFVAIAHTGQAVKLVDRLEFSRANFLNRADKA